ncbi:MAG: hypothetical protein IT168_22135 [Bryobacterales bacterium]|nr:hypothetical protein [Bryobacterales bacterium]
MLLGWQELAPLPVAQGGGAIEAQDGTLVVAGGTRWADGRKFHLTETQIHDPASGKWRAGKPLPYPLAYGAHYAHGGKVIVVGGFDGKDFRPTIFEYDGSWTAKGEAPAPTILGRAVVVGDTVYLLGGCGNVADLSTCHDQIFRRKPGAAWEHYGSLPDGALSLFGAAAFGDEIFIFGGCRTIPGGIENQSTIYAFHTGSRKWRRIGSLAEANRGIAAVTYRDSIFLLGGFSTKFTEAVQRFDPKTAQISPAPPLPLGVMTDFAVVGTKLIGVGGEDAMKHRTERAFALELSNLK